MSRSVVHDWVDLFNSNPLGLRLNFVDDSCRLAGTLRIYINLIKPVKMSLRQTMDMLPASPVDQEGDSRINGSASGGSKRADEGLKDLPSPARLVSFFLPRGTSKIMYITSSTTSVNTVQCLLDRFHIQESPRKFALYEHTLDGKTITVRKIPTSECPLLLLLNWARLSSSREEFYDRLTRKRIVLQENDACDINWNDFTAAELTNFLRILDKEEAEYRNAILYQYGLLRDQIERRMDEICSRANDRDQPKYGRVSVPCHPYAYQPPTSNSQQFGYVPNPMRPGFRMSDRSLSVDAESSAASV
ncbi:unnamed protein product [Calicophoron daubneyi]|uniref:Ras association domain-containing protein 1 n=1 Tax=Calicophoron daubneyi TaxID=300641 RepID=A0AAV2T328_CALDB